MSSSESDDEKKKKKVAKKQVSALQAKKQQQGATKQATREQRNAAARNSSLQVTGKVTNSIVGPINEWKCIPENLPNHPTMVSRLLLFLRVACPFLLLFELLPPSYTKAARRFGWQNEV